MSIGLKKHAYWVPSADRVQRIGSALYGPVWPPAMARAIGVSIPTVHRWRDGAPISARSWDRIAELIDSRLPLLVDIQAQLQDPAQQKHAFLRGIGPVLYGTPAWKAAMAQELDEFSQSLFLSREHSAQSGDIANGARLLGRVAKGLQPAPGNLWLALQLVVSRRLRVLLAEQRASAKSMLTQGEAGQVQP